MMTLQELAHEAHALAEAKGFWDKTDERAERNKLTLIHSEISEAVECVRKGDMEIRYTDTGKPEGFPIEIADIVLRTLDLLSFRSAVLCPAAFLEACYLQEDLDADLEARDLSNPDGIVAELGLLHNWVESDELSFNDTLRVVVNLCHDIAKGLDFNLMEAMLIKHQYNATRPYKHGRAL